MRFPCGSGPSGLMQQKRGHPQQPQLQQHMIPQQPAAQMYSTTPFGHHQHQHHVAAAPVQAPVMQLRAPVLNNAAAHPQHQNHHLATRGAGAHHSANNSFAHSSGTRASVGFGAPPPPAQRFAPQQGAKPSSYYYHDAASKETSAPLPSSVYDPSTASECHSDEDKKTDSYLISNELLEDPVPYLAPKSKKMALGSITFNADQGRQLGVMVKDNSFFLRVEKCDGAFCDELNFQIEKLYNFKVPRGVEDQTEYWPEGALYNYCQKPNASLQREMDRVYRFWHDQRCGMEQLYGRLCQLKNSRGC